MAASDLGELAALITRESEALLSRWRRGVRQLPSARQLETPVLNDHIPRLLAVLAEALQSKSDQTIPEALSEEVAKVHGLQRVEDAFDIEEVVAEYNILRGCIHDLADDSGFKLQGKPFHIINRVFDHAIGVAVQAYASQRALEVKRRRDEYLAFVAHDLGNPLAAISLAGKVLELSLPEKGASAETSRMLKALRRGVQQLEGLLLKVGDENKNVESEIGTRLERREVDLWPLVESLVRELRPGTGGAGARLVNKVADDLTVYADAGLLRRVFQNLIANAVRYTPHGEVVIGAAGVSAEGSVECWVSDNGAGIPKELIQKIFDKGMSDPGKEGGTGLGLAIVKTFIEAHGGKVSVESKQGAGATFRFSLPNKGA